MNAPLITDSIAELLVRGEDEGFLVILKIVLDRIFWKTVLGDSPAPPGASPLEEAILMFGGEE